MRTTVNIDEDVLLAAKQLAHDQGVSVGNVLSRHSQDTPSPDR